MRMVRPVKAAGALVCALLTLAFAAASAGSVVDGVMHELHAPHEHNHLSFADSGFEDHLHFDQDGADFGADHAAPGHHHHYGDGPSGFVAESAAGALLLAQSADAFRRTDETRASLIARGVDHPPKRLSHA